MNYTSTAPEEVTGITGYYVKMINGTAYSVSGAYSNYYFLNTGYIDYTYSSSFPQQSQDDQLYYDYVSGEAIGLADGQLVQNPIDSLYYDFSNGVRTLSQGCYSGTSYLNGATGGYYCYSNGANSVGYISNGEIDTNYTNLNPQIAIDNSKYYTYFQGTASQANGGYNGVGYFTNGEPDVTYNGAYSYGYLLNGLLDTSYTGGPNIGQDINLLYMYSSGIATLANGCIGGNLYDNGTDLQTPC
jgi:hypothetical protein